MIKPDESIEIQIRVDDKNRKMVYFVDLGIVATVAIWWRKGETPEPAIVPGGPLVPGHVESTRRYIRLLEAALAMAESWKASPPWGKPLPRPR